MVSLGVSTSTDHLLLSSNADQLNAKIDILLGKRKFHFLNKCLLIAIFGKLILMAQQELCELLKNVIVKASQMNAHSFDVNQLSASLLSLPDISTNCSSIKQVLVVLQTILQNFLDRIDEVVDPTSALQITDDTEVGCSREPLEQSVSTNTLKPFATSKQPVTSAHAAADRLLPDSNKTTAGQSSVITSKQHSVNEHMVQILGNKASIDERITRFLAWKQNENNRLNIYEFCHVVPAATSASVSLDEDDSTSPTTGESCARTDAIYEHRSGVGGRRVKVMTAYNQYGPQVAVKAENVKHSLDFDSSKAPQPVDTGISKHGISTTNDALPPGVNERLASMETHTKLYSATKPVPRTVYERLQNLENRLLYLESLSPEYFDQAVKVEPRKRFKVDSSTDIKFDASINKVMSTAEIDNRIRQLKQHLMTRQQNVNSTDGT